MFSGDMENAASYGIPDQTTLSYVLNTIREIGSPYAAQLSKRRFAEINGHRPKTVWLARLDRPKEDLSWLVVLNKQQQPAYWRWPWDKPANKVDSLPDDVANSLGWSVFEWNIECKPDNKELGPWYEQNGYKQ